MKIEEVDNHSLYSIDHCIAMELMRAEGKTATDVIKIKNACLLHFRRKVYEGIIEQCQTTTSAVIALRSTYSDELFSDIHHINLEVATLPDDFQQLAATH